MMVEILQLFFCPFKATVTSVIADYITTVFSNTARKITCNIMWPASIPFIWSKLNSVLQADLNEAVKLLVE